MSVALPVNLSMRRSRIVKVTSLQDVRAKHKLLYEHNGKGDADKAERVAWRRGLARAFAVNLIDRATVEVEGYATDILWLVS